MRLCEATWSELKDDEIDQIEGDLEKLEGVIHMKCGKSKDQAKV